MNRSLLDLLDRFAAQTVLVVGDVMLDEHIVGVANRLSAEAPIPVIVQTHTRHVPGGAANVAANAASLGARTALAGVRGDDGAGLILAACLEERGVFTDGIAVDPARPTTTKTRILAQGHQIVRVDRENTSPISPEHQASILAFAASALDRAGVAVLSDYSKGVVSGDFPSAFIEACRARGVPVLVDPKGADFRKYRGATLITPNSKEAFGALSRSAGDIDEAGKSLLEMLPGTAILITRGEEGMSLYRDHQKPLHIVATAREVFDVTGAGDTAVAVLACGIAAGANLETAVRLANVAAGLSVAKRGTATLTLRELREQIPH